MANLLAPTTELEAVNRLLGSIGQGPVNTLEVSGLPDVTTALSTLRETLKDVSTRGWSWNTDRNYTLTPTAEGYLEIPTGTLEVDPETRTSGLVQRRNPQTDRMSLYDPNEQTFEFDSAVDVNIIWAFAFDDIPQVARTYIAIAAARRFQMDFASSDVIERYSQEMEDRAWAALMRVERRTRDANSFRSNREGRAMLQRRF